MTSTTTTETKSRTSSISVKQDARKARNAKIRLLSDRIKRLKEDIHTMAGLKIRLGDNPPELIARVKNIITKHQKP